MPVCQSGITYIDHGCAECVYRGFALKALGHNSVGRGTSVVGGEYQRVEACKMMKEIVETCLHVATSLKAAHSAMKTICLRLLLESSLDSTRGPISGLKLPQQSP
nr:hypothetical protein CFP56_52235 [Quercus suber]POF19987.1 hypothetical protein CFP56_52236 [Quercus suber]